MSPSPRRSHFRLVFTSTALKIPPGSGTDALRAKVNFTLSL